MDKKVTPKSIQSLYESWAKADIKKKAEASKERLADISDAVDVDEQLRLLSDQRAKERSEYYREKAARLGKQYDQQELDADGDVMTVYKARAALNTYKEKKLRKESFIHRTIRLISGLNKLSKENKKRDFLTCEQIHRGKLKIFNDAWQPIMDFLRDAVDNLWDFMCRLGFDFGYIILSIVDVFITIGYYLVSIWLFIWDIFWDIRIALDEKKNFVFQWFAATIAAIAIILIGISSLTAYEYSYYGRTLGITRSKQEVYNTIEALGDKLSAASGANINLDVERDIEFTKIFGFNIDIDTSEEILDTLTYMKDIQVRAFAICIDGEQSVILESQDVANEVLNRVKNDFAPESEGVEYIQIAYDQSITVEEVGVVLGDIWNPDDAVNYLETGDVNGDIEKGAGAMVTLRTVEIATYNQNVKYGYKYIENSSIYADETELISAGVYGQDRVVAQVTRINGFETNRVIQSTKRLSNPVDAVYYQGTKPIPEKKGTGTWILPLKTIKLTSSFGSRNTGIVGASTNHQGVDFGAATGTKIYAADGGVVTYSGWQSGYGYVVIIDHGGLYESRYGHCSKLLVSAGDAVYQGQNIALVGSTGISSGSHLHFEIRYKGVALDPLPFLGLE